MEHISASEVRYCERGYVTARVAANERATFHALAPPVCTKQPMRGAGWFLNPPRSHRPTPQCDALMFVVAETVN